MAFYIVVGILDYSFQYYKIRKDLKMSKDDVKQEHKDLEGDPPNEDTASGNAE
ncbi:secretion system apparatus protein SsaU [Salmonella enterica subsp. enterica]|uniref:Secretion system apparatus protein SsaU n=1 Tax=Salmonella enterica I TaxID=59201 RepID=A0A3S4GL00_SALET|nr:secretion system apparatus protein SsaU [Salmonella enterica subsp. enterica]